MFSKQDKKYGKVCPLFLARIETTIVGGLTGACESMSRQMDKINRTPLYLWNISPPHLNQLKTRLYTFLK